MNLLINRLDICYNNLLLTNDLDKKEKIINKILIILRYCRTASDLINYLFMSNKEMFYEIIDKFKKPCLILMTYDLRTIGKYINIPDDTTLEYYNNSFHIDYIPKSPNNSELEWGLN